VSKLIQEPPLLVLRSLACDLGLNEAIVAQQLYWLEQRAADGWVEKSTAEWRKVFPFWSARTIERIWSKLRDGEAVDVDEQPGKPTRYRTSAKLSGVTPDRLAGDPRQVGGGLSLKEKQQRKTTSNSSCSEPIGFSEWLGRHVELASFYGVEQSVPRAGTSNRATLAATFGALAAERYTAEEFELASEGVLSSEFMREGGHVKPENVLRKTKFAGKVDDGRRARAKRLEGDGRGEGQGEQKWGAE
jgi:hypothetical protein